MKLPRPIVAFGVFAALILLIWVGSALILPRLIDSQLIRSKISSELAKKTGADVTVGKILLFWFPRPAVVLENAELSFGDKTRGSIRTVTIYPSIFYLFSGRVVVRRALLQEPQLRIRLPERSAKPLDLEELEKQIRSALVRLTTDVPAPRIDLSDGSADIEIGDHQRVILENVGAQAVGAPEEGRFEFSARSNLCERFQITGNISSASLASRLDIGIQRLKINESLVLLPLQIAEYAQAGEANFEVKIAAVGLRQVKASIDGSIGPFVIARHGAATVEAKRLKGEITYEGGAFRVDIAQLELGTPRLQASGELKIHSGLLSARIRVRDIDIAEVGDLALRVVDDAEGVKRILRYVPVGRIPEISIQSAGRSFADMALSKNVVVSGLLRDCKIFIPGPDLELQNVTGAVRISDGILEADGVGANLGASKAWNGKLRLGLEGKAAPFHLDMSLHTSATELHAVLLKLVREETFRGELLKVQNITGELSGRLILGERLNAISPVVTITKAEISAAYAPIPFPIAVRGGPFSYDQRLIRLENAEGSVGGSSFGGLGLTLHRDGSRQINVDAGRVSLDLQQTDTLLRSFKDVRPHLGKLKSMRGQIELANLTLTGTYDDPAGWKFATGGMVKQVELRHEDLPGPVTVTRGKFAANQARIKFSDAAASVQDASLIIDGIYEGAIGAPLKLEASGSGTIGEKMTQWLSRQIELPQELLLRSPLKIIAGQTAWRSGGDVSFRGKGIVAGGPQIFLDGERDSQNIIVRDLTVEDGARHARMTLKFAKDNLDLSFDGTLGQQTLNRVFASWPSVLAFTIN